MTSRERLIAFILKHGDISQPEHAGKLWDQESLLALTWQAAERAGAERARERIIAALSDNGETVGGATAVREMTTEELLGDE